MKRAHYSKRMLRKQDCVKFHGAYCMTEFIGKPLCWFLRCSAGKKNQDFVQPLVAFPISISNISYFIELKNPLLTFQVWRPCWANEHKTCLPPSCRHSAIIFAVRNLVIDALLTVCAICECFFPPPPEGSMTTFAVRPMLPTDALRLERVKWAILNQCTYILKLFWALAIELIF